MNPHLCAAFLGGARHPLPLASGYAGERVWERTPRAITVTAMATRRCGRLRRCRCRRRGHDDGSGLPRPHCLLNEINDVP
jgi:hypothetical protein